MIAWILMGIAIVTAALLLDDLREEIEYNNGYGKRTDKETIYYLHSGDFEEIFRRRPSSAAAGYHQVYGEGLQHRLRA
jgi:hypothetical protein